MDVDPGPSNFTNAVTTNETVICIFEQRTEPHYDCCFCSRLTILSNVANINTYRAPMKED